MSAFDGQGAIIGHNFCNKYLLKNAPIHPGNLLQDAFSIHMSKNICGKRTSRRGKEKIYSFILYINYLEEKSPKTCIWAARPFYNIILRIQKQIRSTKNQKQLELKIILLNKATGHVQVPPTYVCFWLDDFLAEPKSRRMVHMSPAILSMLSIHFSYALKPVKTRAVPAVDNIFSHLE